MKQFIRLWLGPILLGIALVTTVSYFKASKDFLPATKSTVATAELSKVRYRQLVPHAQAAFRLSSQPDWNALPNLFTDGVPPENFFVREVPDDQAFSGETHVVFAGILYSGIETGSGARRIHVRKTDRPVTLMLIGGQASEWQVDVDPDAKVEKIIAVPNDNRDKKEIPVRVRDGVQVVHEKMEGHWQFRDYPQGNKVLEKISGYPVFSAQTLPRNGMVEVPLYKDYQAMVDIPKAHSLFRGEKELKTTKLSLEQVPSFPKEVMDVYKPNGKSLTWQTPLYIRSTGKYFVMVRDYSANQGQLVTVDPTTKEIKPISLSISSSQVGIVGFHGQKNELILRTNNDVVGYNVQTGEEHAYGQRPGLWQIYYHEKLGRLFGVEPATLLVEYDAELNPIKKTPLHSSLKNDGTFDLREIRPMGDQFFARGSEAPRLQHGGAPHRESEFLPLLIDPQSGLVQELAVQLVGDSPVRKPSGQDPQ